MRKSLFRATVLAGAVLCPLTLTACGPIAVVTLPGDASSTAPATTPAALATAAPSAAPTATAAPAAAPASASPSTALTDASAVVTQFYADISDGDYQDAWDLGGDNIAGTTYAQWVAGYSTTASISLGTVSSFGPGQLQAEIIADQDDGTVNAYEGTYTVENGVIVSADITQTS
ncbi:MAG TPA: hypothetical protein VGG75_24260 [Trebonia sp.]|jgi:hypothetical protein